MGKASRIPDILIEGDIGLTADIWLGLDKKPFVLSPNILRCPLKEEIDGKGNRLVSSLDPLALFDPALSGGADEKLVREVRLLLGEIREVLGLPPDATMTVAMAGTHTRSGSQVRTDHLSKGKWRELHPDTPYFADMKTSGVLSGKLAAVLEYFGLEMVWLADAFDFLTPPAPDRPEPEFDKLARRERDRLAKLPSPARDEAGQPGRRSALPAIYMRVEPAGDWQRFVLDDENDPPSATGRLLDRFERLAPETLADALLLKVLPAGIADCNPLDPPMISILERERAKALGIRAVLLDGRYGIVVPPDPDDTRLADVYAA